MITRTHQCTCNLRLVGRDTDGFLVAGADGVVRRFEAGRLVTTWATGTWCRTAVTHGDLLCAADADYEMHLTRIVVQTAGDSPRVLREFDDSIGVSEMYLDGETVVLNLWKRSAVDAKAAGGIVMLGWNDHYPYFRWGCRLIALSCRTGEVLRELGTTPPTPDLNQIRDGQYHLFPALGLIVRRNHGEIGFLDARTFELTSSFRVDLHGEQRANSVEMSPAGDRVLVLLGTRSQSEISLVIFDRDGQELWRYDNQEDYPTCLCWSRDSRSIRIGDSAHLTRLDARDGTVLTQAEIPNIHGMSRVGDNVLLMGPYRELFACDGESLRRLAQAEAPCAPHNWVFATLDSGDFIVLPEEKRPGDTPTGDEPVSTPVLCGRAPAERQPLRTVGAPFSSFAHLEKPAEHMVLAQNYYDKLTLYCSGATERLELNEHGLITKRRPALRESIGLYLRNRSVEPEIITRTGVAPWSCPGSVTRQELGFNGLSFVSCASGGKGPHFDTYAAHIAACDEGPLLVLHISEMIPAESIPMSVEGSMAFQLDRPAGTICFLSPTSFLISHPDGHLTAYKIHGPDKPGANRKERDLSQPRPVRIQRVAEYESLPSARAICHEGDTVVTVSRHGIDVIRDDALQPANWYESSFDLWTKKKGLLSNVRAATPVCWRREFPEGVIDAVMVVPHDSHDWILVATTAHVHLFDRRSGAKRWSHPYEGLLAVAGDHRCDREYAKDLWAPFAMLSDSTGDIVKFIFDEVVLQPPDDSGVQTVDLDLRLATNDLKVLAGPSEPEEVKWIRTAPS
ncbi:hypothetical protein ACFL6C_11570 [Myxococcota bacterium]